MIFLEKSGKQYLALKRIGNIPSLFRNLYKNQLAGIKVTKDESKIEYKMQLAFKLGSDVKNIFIKNSFENSRSLIMGKITQNINIFISIKMRRESFCD